MDTPNAFAEELRRALRHLYDPVSLRKSPLIGLFGLQEARNPAEALRNVLEKGVAALQPDAETPAACKNSRSYQILFYRYVQQFTQRDVAHQLDISSRHLRREQALAIEALAEELRTEFNLSSEIDKLLAPDHGGGDSGATSESVDREMSWLGDSLGDQVADVPLAMHEAMRLAEMVACRHHVQLESTLARDLPPLAIASTVLKQVVLNLSTTAIHSVPGGTVVLAAQREANGVAIQVTARPNAQGECRAPERDGLDMAGRLVALFQGKMVISPSEGPLTARVTLPSAEQIIVLVIEDNLDTIQLWERYVQGTRFRIVSTREPQRALALAAELRPRLIVLDVMMPEVDGWELLGQLRNHPTTSGTPIIVCTVLPQEELAISLGASDFMRKPVTRPAFQAVLWRQIEALAPGSAPQERA